MQSFLASNHYRDVRFTSSPRYVKSFYIFNFPIYSQGQDDERNNRSGVTGAGRDKKVIDDPIVLLLHCVCYLCLYSKSQQVAVALCTIRN